MTFATDRRWIPQPALQIVFPFDLHRTSTTVLASSWETDGWMKAPMIISAPDYGQVLLKVERDADFRGRLEGDRASARIINLVLELPPLAAENQFTLDFTPVILDAPAGVEDSNTWRLARRGWFGAFQPAAAVGDPKALHNKYAISGVLTCKNVDALCSFQDFLYADMMLWTPELAPGISAAQMVRQSIDFFLQNWTLLSGAVIGYSDYADFMDSNPAMLICAWDYVEATSDLTWLEKTIAQLERVANFMAMRDVDNDGLIEAPQSGNARTCILPIRCSNWFDAINYGYKDAYSNALAYRGVALPGGFGSSAASGTAAGSL